MFRVIQALLLSGVLLLTACGGGSSGGAGSGTYSGTYEVFDLDGVGGSGTYVATISGDSVRLTLNNGTVLTGEITRSGDAAVGNVTGPIAGVLGGCTSGTISFIIIFNEEGFSGLVGGENVICGGVSVSIVGTHKATRS